MAQKLFVKGREGFGTGTVTTGSGTFKARLLTLATTANLVKAITACTGAASPITLTVGSTTGWANGNYVLVRGITGNTCANGVWVIANLTGTTFDLQTVPRIGGAQLASTGNGAATVTNATVTNLSLSSASTDLSAAAGGSTDQTLTSVGITNGIFTSANPSWASVAANTVIDAIAVFQSAPTDRLVYITDGKIQVRVDAAASTSATTLFVEPLYAPIPNSSTIPLSNGVVATLTAGANAGDTSLTVSALSAGVAIGHTGDVAFTNGGLPVTLGSQPTTFNYTVDATNGWFLL
ncbi:MAG: hypothetical protein HXX08_11345 [Chloroflexi bacterium]|uniref:Uncharacterized protein n=1 Tax=Candidatus Chlorohelix allophototropha TaxID=3003348 RepID=A0A8T7LWX2_9CHLR|nr:hypothetical protein [Chloroflexota bacterium]WJW65832.1 hypothetical protein OZ401_001611 [Chloroflexota bacterium L227-S17]